jgi:ABC-type Na+ efflux pump permease subunit
VNCEKAFGYSCAIFSLVMVFVSGYMYAITKDKTYLFGSGALLFATFMFYVMGSILSIMPTSVLNKESEGKQ